MVFRKTMNVSLTPEIEAFVVDRVTSGRYRTQSEVVRAALRLLQTHERRLNKPEEPKPIAGKARVAR